MKNEEEENTGTDEYDQENEVEGEEDGEVDDEDEYEAENNEVSDNPFMHYLRSNNVVKMRQIFIEYIENDSSSLLSDTNNAINFPFFVSSNFSHCSLDMIKLFAEYGVDLNPLSTVSYRSITLWILLVYQSSLSRSLK